MVDAPGLFVNIAKYLRSDKSTKMEVIFITTYFQYLGLNEIFFSRSWLSRAEWKITKVVLVLFSQSEFRSVWSYSWQYFTIVVADAFTRAALVSPQIKVALSEKKPKRCSRKFILRGRIYKNRMRIAASPLSLRVYFYREIPPIPFL